MTPTHLPTVAIAESRKRPLDESVAEGLVGHTLANVERALILKTLNDLEGNRTQAASVLGISVRCLRDKIRQFREQGIAIPAPHRSII
jgi:two-component system response regulator FlrC